MDPLDFDNLLTSSETIGLLILKELKMMRQDVIASMLRMEEQISNLSGEQSKTQDQKFQCLENQSSLNSCLSAIANDGDLIGQNVDVNSKGNESCVSPFENCSLEPIFCKEEIVNETSNSESKTSLIVLTEKANNFPCTSDNSRREADSYVGQLDECVKTDIEEQVNITDENRSKQFNTGKSNLKNQESRESTKNHRVAENCIQDIFPTLPAELHVNVSPSKSCRKKKPFLKLITGAGNNENRMQCSFGEKKFACQICKKRFTRSELLVRHMIIHAKEREKVSLHNRFKKPITSSCRSANENQSLLNDKICPYCFKKYSSVGNLKRHIRSHTNDKRYQCTVCLKRFLRQEYLNSHLLTHS